MPKHKVDHKVDHVRDLCFHDLYHDVPAKVWPVHRCEGRFFIGQRLQTDLYLMSMSVKRVTNGNVLRHLHMMMRENFNVHA